MRDVIDEIFAILTTKGTADYIGEDVSQLAHALQCAKLAADSCDDDELIIAVLLHDIGHICAEGPVEQMGTFGVAHHEKIGANYLRSKGFSERVACLIERHVDAKRYLTFRNPRYAAKLSSASAATLRYQGGPMTAEEAAKFEQEPELKDVLKIRVWEENAKAVGSDVPALEAYRDLLARHLGGACRAQANVSSVGNSSSYA